MPTGIWTNEGTDKINEAIAVPEKLPINKFVLSGAATVGGVTDPFVEDVLLTEATFPDEIYRADTDQTFIDADGYLVVDSEILASITDVFYANGIGLIYDDGLGNPDSKTLLAVAALPLQGREEGVFTRYRFKLPLSGKEDGLVINFNPDDHVTPTELYAAVAGHGHWNAITNGCTRVGQGNDYTLVKDAYAFGKVDRFEGMATGTTVAAGTLTQKLNSGLSRNGFSLHFSGVTLTGSGELYLRHRIFSADAKYFKNQKASFAARVSHDVGAAVDYTVFVRKANAQDDFSAVTEIANSGAQSIASGANSDLLFENIDMGDCSNGIEIEIKVEPGAITTKNFEFAELQLEVGQTKTAFALRPIAEELSLCQRGAYAVDTGTANAYVIALEPILAEHIAGLPIWFKAGNTNTGASTLNEGPGAMTIKKNYNHDLAPGDIKAGQIIGVVCDGTNFQLLDTPVRGIVQVVHTETGAVSTSTSTFTNDDTIPPITEGTEFMTLTITPTSASNWLLVEVEFNFTANQEADYLAALFQDANTNALKVSPNSRSSGANWNQIILQHYFPAGTTSPTTLRIRVGLITGGGTMTFNGIGAARKFGGVLVSGMTAMEIEA